MVDDSRLQVSLFGRPALRWQGEVVKVPTRKALALVGYLAVTGTAAPRERLCELLHTDRRSLRQELHRLRGLPGAAHWLVAGERVAVLAESDIERFTGAVEGKNYEAALTLWNGNPPPFQDLPPKDSPAFEDWLEVEHTRLEALLRDALRGHAEVLERAGDAAEALMLLQQLIALDPLDESAHRMMMRLEFGRGYLDAALAQFERCRRQLAQELGVEPMPETLELARAVEQTALDPPVKFRMTLKRRLPPKLLRPPALVGREREWAEMEAAWDAGKLIFISGPPGSGKTRLMLDFARTKGRYLLTSGRPGDAAVPFSSLARMLRQYLDAYPEAGFEPWVRVELARLVPERFPEQPGAITSEEERLRFVGAVGVFLLSASYLVDMLLSDDIQFYDASTFQTGMYLSLMLTDRGLVKGQARPISCFRSGEVPADYERGVREAAEQGAVVHIELEPLSQEATAALLTSLEIKAAEALAPRLHALTGGNPQFIMEVLKALHEQGEGSSRLPDLADVGVPERVGLTIERRLKGLSKGALRLAQALAAWQTPAPVAALAVVLELREGEVAELLAELQGAQVLRENAFVHDLLYETVRRTTPFEVGRLLHRRIAGVLEQQGGEPARVAAHWERGGEMEKALPWRFRAAETALTQGSFDKARVWLEQVRHTAAPESELFTKASALLERAARIA